MNVLKKYKYILGKPFEGVHSYRFGSTAIVDYVMTIVAAMTTSYFSGIPLELTTIAWFTTGIFLHLLFGVNTSTTKFLGTIAN